MVGMKLVKDKTAFKFFSRNSLMYFVYVYESYELCFVNLHCIYEWLILRVLTILDVGSVTLAAV
jgi:hypothetical protein